MVYLFLYGRKFLCQSRVYQSLFLIVLASQFMNCVFIQDIDEAQK